MVLQQASLLHHVVARRSAEGTRGVTVATNKQYNRAVESQTAARPRAIWPLLTIDDEQNYEMNLHRWAAARLAEDIEQAESEPTAMLYNLAAGGPDLGGQLALSKAMTENPDLLRRNLALRRVKRFKFAPTGRRRGKTRAWRQAQAIDRVMELVLSELRPEDIGRAAQVSRRWRWASVALDHAWKLICMRDYPALIAVRAAIGGTYRQLLMARVQGEAPQAQVCVTVPPFAPVGAMISVMVNGQQVSVKVPTGATAGSQFMVAAQFLAAAAQAKGKHVAPLRVMAAHDSESAEPTDDTERTLGFTVGDVVIVTDFSSDLDSGWWKGYVDGKPETVGYFQEFRVEMLPEILGGFMIGVEITDSEGGSMSFVKELRNHSWFVDHQTEGAQEEPYEFDTEYLGDSDMPKFCEEDFEIHAFLVRKADSKIISLGNSRKDIIKRESVGGYVGVEGLNLQWNVLAWRTPQLVADAPFGSQSRIPIVATFSSESTLESRTVTRSLREVANYLDEPSGLGNSKLMDNVHVSRYEDNVRVHKVTGVKLAMIEEFGVLDPRAGMLRLLKQIQKDHPLRQQMN